ncbi:MAG: hypothetical protein CVU38_21255 [Chloroflexi bacterium HGW-Chloroflexi-1]|nr:MAG: hypothetical protein CVU38_21255 [Chloroflexi bacterium HGW-Chloroflexi-1]
MKDQWYGDARDLVKWGILTEIAQRFNAVRILQVLYLRETAWKKLEVDGEPVALPRAVVDHFRNVRNIGTLKGPAEVEVFDRPFADRTEYLSELVERIRAGFGGTAIIFLDPDTGLEPTRPGPEHVLNSELATIWREVAVGDVLVFYQHQTNKNGLPWIALKQAQFERALGVSSGTAKLARAPEIAQDVVFFFCQKSPISSKTAG